MSRDISLHEDYRDAEPVAGSSDRSFGCTVGGILIAFGAFKGFMAGAITTPAWASFVIGALLLVFGIVAPSHLALLNRLWMRLGAALAAVVNPLVLALLFYLLFTAMALAMRLFGKRPLRLAPDPMARTYWLPRQPAEAKASDMRRQF